MFSTSLFVVTPLPLLVHSPLSEELGLYGLGTPGKFFNSVIRCIQAFDAKNKNCHASLPFSFLLGVKYRSAADMIMRTYRAVLDDSQVRSGRCALLFGCQ